MHLLPWFNAHSNFENYTREHSDLATSELVRFDNVMSQLVIEIFFWRLQT